MDICGNVYVSKDLTEFSLKCTNCRKKLENWIEFREHIRSEICSVQRDSKNAQDEPLIDQDTKAGILEIIEPMLAEVTVKEEDLPLSFLLGNANDEHSVKDELENETDPMDESIFHISENLDEYSPTEDSSDESYSDEKNKQKKTSVSKFSPSFYRRDESTSAFIDLYRSQRCLWDSNDSKFSDKGAHAESYKAMINTIKEDFNVELKERKLKSIIQKMRQQYYETQKTAKRRSLLNPHIKSLAMVYYEKCSFLGEIKGKDNETETEAERDPELKKTGLGNRYKIFSYCKKSLADAIIELYKGYPELYNRNHSSYTNNLTRKEIYAKMLDVLNEQYAAGFSMEDLTKYITSLRHWHSHILKKRAAGQALNVDEESYFQKCNFIPERVKQRRIKCEHCDCFFTTESNYQKHVYEKHQVGEAMEHQCEQCKRNFAQSSSLHLHIQRYHSEKKFACEFCQRKFAVKADWRLHVRTHTNEKPYICDQCGKAFRLRNQLGNHVITIHTRERAFKCTMCPKDFYKKTHLKDHIKAHLNIRDKICETCGKGFTNCHSLIRHRQIHSEIKKFCCKLCDAKFHQFVGLNSHMKRTHNIVRNKPKDE